MEVRPAAGVQEMGAMFLVEPVAPSDSAESAQALDLLGRISAVLHPRKRSDKGKMLMELHDLIDKKDDSVRFIQAERYGDAPSCSRTPPPPLPESVLFVLRARTKFCVGPCVRQEPQVDAELSRCAFGVNTRR
jgi:hypothetical protein